MSVSSWLKYNIKRERRDCRKLPYSTGRGPDCSIQITPGAQRILKQLNIELNEAVITFLQRQKEWDWGLITSEVRTENLKTVRGLVHGAAGTVKSKYQLSNGTLVEVLTQITKGYFSTTVHLSSESEFPTMSSAA